MIANVTDAATCLKSISAGFMFARLAMHVKSAPHAAHLYRSHKPQMPKMRLRIAIQSGGRSSWLTFSSGSAVTLSGMRGSPVGITTVDRRDDMVTTTRRRAAPEPSFSALRDCRQPPRSIKGVD
eukprot:CAMPEP_0203808542 /NCGR_PEP_ID=MMETSP0115-20131106/1682_1 /ASSEMBLY_ACC=CAM_ASM_000227 /TAXON_ID=33651 /ORGANISM="Bicosoecid sp, Strain ms1" /LENGTH=123 /DNA_ID=CAMNT_0050717233 /DNA_START=144 /DNA_END=515 /DNA_ORIENTATION=+